MKREASKTVEPESSSSVTGRAACPYMKGCSTFSKSGRRASSAIGWMSFASEALPRNLKGFLKPLRLAPGITVAGAIAVGYPSPAEEALRDIISIDKYLITRAESSFLVKVRGASMTGAGIMNGDMVIVEKGREPGNGDIVRAEGTMKYFIRKRKGIVLEAANEKYPTIRAKNELRLGGVIAAVIRKYHL